MHAKIDHRVRMFYSMASEAIQEVPYKRLYRLFHAFLTPVFASAVTASIGL